MASFQVSQSKVRTYLTCRRSYHYKYVEGIRKRVRSRPLQFGIMMHELLEAVANKEDPFELLDEIKVKQGKIFAAEREMYGDIVEDCRIIFKAYLDHYGNDTVRYILYNGKRAEHWIEVEISEDIILVMKIDGFAKINGLRWIVEHKTGKSIMGEDDRWRNLQTAVYLRACEMVGIRAFDGIFWNFVRSKAPLRPQKLKTGGLSIKRIDTLPSVVRATIKEHGLDEADNQELLSRAKANIPSYFQRVFTPKNKDVVDTLFTDLVCTAQEMRDFHGKRSQRTVGRHCGWCDYEAICRAELTGGDPDFVKEKLYDGREDRRKNSR